MKKKSRFPLLYIGLVLLFLYLPMALVLVYSFNESKSSAVWGGFTLRWYAAMPGDKDLLGALWVSLKVAALSASISAVVGALGAVGMNRLGKRMKAFLSGISYIPLIIPEIVLGAALLMFFSVMPIPRGITPLVLSHTAFSVPYVLFLVRVRLAGIDESVLEAAVDLGARPAQLFFTITLPLIFPAIVSGALLAVAMSLDDVVISSFVAGPGTTPLPVKIFSMLKLGVTPRINALCTVLLLFTFLSVGLISALTERQRGTAESAARPRGDL